MRGGGSKPALAAALGATLPDIPMALGAAWLWTKKRRFPRPDFDIEVCGRSRFREPDAALHSALATASAMLVEHALRGKPSHGNHPSPAFPFRASDNLHGDAPADFASAFLLGWAGHVFVDFLTHGKDARPVLWPFSKWKFESPISYRDNERHGTAFTIFEHAAVFGAAALLLLEARRNARRS